MGTEALAVAVIVAMAMSAAVEVIFISSVSICCFSGTRFAVLRIGNEWVCEFNSRLPKFSMSRDVWRALLDKRLAFSHYWLL
jgi:Asp/Glu/hydantoin racemase